MIEILSSDELARARRTGALVGDILQALRRRTGPGTNLLDVDRWTRALIAEAGAQSCYVDYAPSFGRGPFGHVICTSVNDAVLHGLPHPYKLRDGDLLTMDMAVTIDGWSADSALSVVVGTPAPEDLRLIEATEVALEAAIEVARPGNRLGDVSAAIGAVAAEYGYPVNLEFGGHGIGRTMHEDPHIPNQGRPGRGWKLRPGLTLAIEPWFTAGTDKIRFDADGWTIRSADGSRAAHSEHTVAITESEPLVLTRRPREDKGAAEPRTSSSGTGH